MPFGKKATDFPRVDDPSIRELYVDALGRSYFDGQTFHLELCAMRMEQVKPPNGPTGKRQVVGRLVFNSEAALDLLNTCMQMAGALHKAGLIKKMPDAKTSMN